MVENKKLIVEKIGEAIELFEKSLKGIDESLD